MAKNLSSFASSLRSDNPKAIMLINAIVHENIDFVTKILTSAPSKLEKSQILESIKIQHFSGQEIKSDTHALFKLAAENTSESGIKIKFLVSNFISQFYCSEEKEHEQGSMKKFSLKSVKAWSMDTEIDLMLSCYTTTKLAGMDSPEAALELQAI